AIDSYLFNSQLVNLPGGGMALMLPREARANARVIAYLDDLVAGNGPVRRLEFVDVRESMRNGGGPACLRLRVVAEPATIDPRFLLDLRKLDRLEQVVERHWPDSIAPADLGHSDLWQQCRVARAALLDELDLTGLL
ncbi:MAG: N-succinylarginine dihydrolase, partial [Janthinobacterium lividum]